MLKTDRSMAGLRREKAESAAAVAGSKPEKSYDEALREVALDHHGERQMAKVRRAVIDSLEGRPSAVEEVQVH